MSLRSGGRGDSHKREHSQRDKCSSAKTQFQRYLAIKWAEIELSIAWRLGYLRDHRGGYPLKITLPNEHNLSLSLYPTSHFSLTSCALHVIHRQNNLLPRLLCAKRLQPNVVERSAAPPCVSLPAALFAHHGREEER